MEERISGSFGCDEKVCIQTDQIYDSCRSKECIECLRVFLTETGQEAVDRAIDVKCRKAEVIWIFPNVEPLSFNRGYYTVDLTYFFRITLEVYTGVSRPVTVEGLSSFNKKVVLFGSDGSAKIFTSKYKEDSFDPQLWQKTNMPKAVADVCDTPSCDTPASSMGEPERFPHRKPLPTFAVPDILSVIINTQNIDRSTALHPPCFARRARSGSVHRALTLTKYSFYRDKNYISTPIKV